MAIAGAQEAAPHESVFSHIASQSNRSEAVIRSRWLRLRSVLTWLKIWTPVCRRMERLKDCAEPHATEKLKQVLLLTRGYIRLLDYFYAAVRIAKLEEDAEWIPRIPKRTLFKDLAHSDSMLTLTRDDAGIKRLIRDKQALLVQINAGIEQLATEERARPLSAVPGRLITSIKIDSREVSSSDEMLLIKDSNGPETPSIVADVLQGGDHLNSSPLSRVDNMPSVLCIDTEPDAQSSIASQKVCDDDQQAAIGFQVGSRILGDAVHSNNESPSCRKAIDIASQLAPVRKSPIPKWNILNQPVENRATAIKDSQKIKDQITVQERIITPIDNINTSNPPDLKHGSSKSFALDIYNRAIKGVIKASQPIPMIAKAITQLENKVPTCSPTEVSLPVDVPRDSATTSAIDAAPEGVSKTLVARSNLVSPGSEHSRTLVVPLAVLPVLATNEQLDKPKQSGEIVVQDVAAQPEIAENVSVSTMPVAINVVDSVQRPTRPGTIANLLFGSRRVESEDTSDVDSVEKVLQQEFQALERENRSAAVLGRTIPEAAQRLPEDGPLGAKAHCEALKSEARSSVAVNPSYDTVDERFPEPFAALLRAASVLDAEEASNSAEQVRAPASMSSIHESEPKAIADPFIEQKISEVVEIEARPLIDISADSSDDQEKIKASKPPEEVQQTSVLSINPKNDEQHSALTPAHISIASEEDQEQSQTRSLCPDQQSTSTKQLAGSDASCDIPTSPELSLQDLIDLASGPPLELPAPAITLKRSTKRPLEEMVVDPTDSEPSAASLQHHDRRRRHLAELFGSDLTDSEEFSPDESDDVMLVENVNTSVFPRKESTLVLSAQNGPGNATDHGRRASIATTQVRAREKSSQIRRSESVPSPARSPPPRPPSQHQRHHQHRPLEHPVLMKRVPEKRLQVQKHNNKAWQDLCIPAKKKTRL